MEAVPDNRPGVSDTHEPADGERSRQGADATEAVVEALQRLAREHGVSTLSYHDYQRMRHDGDPAPVTATRIFGTWREALRAAGLTVDDDSTRIHSEVDRPRSIHHGGVPDEHEMEQAIIAAITRIAGKLGNDVLSTNQYVRHVEEGEPAVITVIRRFGGWKNACEAAGLAANPYSKAGEVRVSDDTALDGVRRAGRAYQNLTGREATRMTQAFYTEWRKANGGLGVPGLTKRFGQWAAVKAEAGLDTIGKQTTKGR